MNIWLLVVVLGVVAMVVGPVMLLQPSAHERRLAGLRERARAQGVVVSMQALPRQATDMEEPGRRPAYRIPAAKGGGPTQPWMLIRSAYRHESHFLESWAWEGPGRASAEEQEWLTQRLPRLPRSVKAVSGDVRGWSVYWTEAGGDESLDAVLTFLNDLKAGA